MDEGLGQRLLFTLREILEEVDIPFFLIQGTALGAYRDNGFCPTDRDIDLGILMEELEPKSEELICSLVSKNLDIEVFVHPLRKPRTIVVWADGVKADIVGMIGHRTKDGRNVRYTFGPVRPWVDKAYAVVHSATMFERLDKIAMFDVEWDIPADIERYLESEYGVDWRIPADDSVSRLRDYDFLEREGIL